MKVSIILIDVMNKGLKGVMEVNALKNTASHFSKASGLNHQNKMR